jgi:hypothetical protein
LYTKKHRLIQNMVDQIYVKNVYKQVYKNIVTLMQTALLLKKIIHYAAH